jgi:hypothetical protein
MALSRTSARGCRLPAFSPVPRSSQSMPAMKHVFINAGPDQAPCAAIYLDRQLSSVNALLHALTRPGVQQPPSFSWRSAEPPPGAAGCPPSPHGRARWSRGRSASSATTPLGPPRPSKRGSSPPVEGPRTPGPRPPALCGKLQCRKRASRASAKPLQHSQLDRVIGIACIYLVCYSHLVRGREGGEGKERGIGWRGGHQSVVTVAFQ